MELEDQGLLLLELEPLVRVLRNPGAIWNEPQGSTSLLSNVKKEAFSAPICFSSRREGKGSHGASTE